MILALLITLIVVSFSMLACADVTTSDTDSVEPTVVFTLSTTQISVVAGGTQQSVSLTMNGITGIPTWSSANESIATVTSMQGGTMATVRGESEGQTTITVTLGEHSATANVAVVEGAYLTITSPMEVSLLVGGISHQIQYESTITPVLFSSDNSLVATVTDTGLITGIGYGTTNIVVRAGGITQVVQVSVIAPSVTLDRMQANMLVGDTLNLTAVAVGGNPSWNTSANNIASVVGNGLTATVTANAVGHAYISATIGGASAIVRIDITQEFISVTVTPATQELHFGQTHQLFAVVRRYSDENPDGVYVTGADANVTWSVVTGGGQFVNVSATGLVTANEVEGIATIRATSTLDNTTFGETTITVMPVPHGTFVVSNRDEFLVAMQGVLFAQSIVLTADIDMAGHVADAGRLAGPYGTFNGLLDGQGHRIYNLTVSSFFGDSFALEAGAGMGSNAIIRNLHLEVTQTGPAEHALFGRAPFFGTIENSFFDITFTAGGMKSALATQMAIGSAIIDSIFVLRGPAGGIAWGHNGLFLQAPQTGAILTNVFVHRIGSEVPAGGTILIDATGMNTSSTFNALLQNGAWVIQDGIWPRLRNAGDMTATISITTPDRAVLEIGATNALQLVATTDPVGGIVFSSSNSAIATVTTGGLVIGVSAGTVTITATNTVSGNTDTIELTILPLPTFVNPVRHYMEIGETLQLTLVGNRGYIEFSSNFAEFATVDSNGFVTALTAGETLIIVHSSINPDVSTSIPVIVLPRPTLTISTQSQIVRPNSAVTVTPILSRGTASVAVSGSGAGYIVGNIDDVFNISDTIQFTIASNATDGAVITLTITSTIYIGASITVTITIEREAPLTVSLNQESLSLYFDGFVGDTATLLATVTNYETNSGVIWEATNIPPSASPVISVENGVVTALSVGTARIVARSIENPTVYAYADVTVRFIQITVAIEEPQAILTITGYIQLTTQLTAIVNRGGYVWSSSDTDIAIVSQTGLITAIAGGRATIVLTSTRDNSVYAYITARVLSLAVTNLPIDPPPVSRLELEVGSGFSIEYAVVPQDHVVHWMSIDANIVTISDNTITAIAVGTTTIQGWVAGRMLYNFDIVVVSPTLGDFTRISTRAELLSAFISTNADTNFYLYRDIDMEGWTGGILFNARFTGILDGRGYEIFNFSVDSFMLGVGEGAIIRNIIITMNHTGGGHVSPFGRAGQPFSGRIENTVLDINFTRMEPNLSGLTMLGGVGSVVQDVLIIMRGTPGGSLHALAVQGGLTTISNVFVVNLSSQATVITGNGGTMSTASAARHPNFATAAGWNTSIWNSSIEGEFPTLIPLNPANIALPRVALSHNGTETLTIGGELQLTVSIIPTRVANRTLNWQVIGEDGIITLENGLVTAVAPGTAIVRVTSVANPTSYVEVEILVLTPSDLPAVTLSSTRRHLRHDGADTFMITATTRSGIGVATFTSSNPAVVTVINNGNVATVTRSATANLGDRAYITASYDDGIAQTFIYIYDNAGRIEMYAPHQFTGNLTGNRVIVQDIDFGGIPRTASIHIGGTLDGLGHSLKNITVTGASNHFIYNMHGGSVLRNVSFINMIMEQGTASHQSVIRHMHPVSTLENVFFDVDMRTRQLFSAVINAAHGASAVRNVIFATYFGTTAVATGQVAGVREGGANVTNNFVDTSAFGGIISLIGVGAQGRTREQLIQASYFNATWDASWIIVDGYYPILRNAAIHT